jgi:fatty acid desaturase
MGSFSLIPIMLIGLPRIYGAWHMIMCGLLQHGGLVRVSHDVGQRFQRMTGTYFA